MKSQNTAKERVLKHSLISIICSEAKAEKYQIQQNTKKELKFQIAVLLIKLFKLYLIIYICCRERYVLLILKEMMIIHIYTFNDRLFGSVIELNMKLYIFCVIKKLFIIRFNFKEDL